MVVRLRGDGDDWGMVGWLVGVLERAWGGVLHKSRAERYD